MLGRCAPCGAACSRTMADSSLGSFLIGSPPAAGRRFNERPPGGGGSPPACLPAGSHTQALASASILAPPSRRSPPAPPGPLTLTRWNIGQCLLPGRRPWHLRRAGVANATITVLICKCSSLGHYRSRPSRGAVVHRDRDFFRSNSVKRLPGLSQQDS